MGAGASGEKEAAETIKEDVAVGAGVGTGYGRLMEAARTRPGGETARGDERSCVPQPPVPNPLHPELEIATSWIPCTHPYHPPTVAKSCCRLALGPSSVSALSWTRVETP